MTSKSAPQGGLLPNLRMGKPKPKKRDPQAEEAAEIKEKHRRLKQAYLRRQRKRGDWRLPDGP